MLDPEAVCEAELEDILTELIQRDPTVTAAIADTNATGYTLASYELEEARSTDAVNSGVHFRASVTLDGEQMQEKPYSGDQIFFDLEGTLEAAGSKWDLVDHSVDNCRSNV